MLSLKVSQFHPGCPYPDTYQEDAHPKPHTAMSGISRLESPFPFRPNRQEISSSYKTTRGSGNLFDQSRRSSSESGFSDANMSPKENQKRVDMSNYEEDSLSRNMSKMQLRSSTNPLPSQLYSYWDQPSFWRDNMTDTDITKQITSNMSSPPLLDSEYQAAKIKTTPTKQHIRSPEKSCEDWLRLKLEQRSVETTPPRLPPKRSPP